MYNQINSENKRSKRIKELFEENENNLTFIDARKVAADDDISVLITGESGTGKEVLAQYVHENSSRADKPFIIANVASLPSTLISSLLFGHIKGSFTGAIDNQKGLIKEADGGTIFLDEIGDMDFGVQVLLLRFLDYGEIIPVGASKPETVDVRVIAATNAKLLDKISDGLFREDLYFRLRGTELHLEPLRAKSADQRKEALEKLISDTAKRKNKSIMQLTASAWDFLLNYEFRGNYREARNIVVKMYAEDKSIIDIQDIEKTITHYNYTSQIDHESNIKSVINTCCKPHTLKEQNAIIVYNTLQRHKGVKNDALKELDITFKTLNSHLSVYNSVGNIPDSIGNIPTDNRKISNSNFQD